MLGFINILKSPGYTSQDVVCIVKGILKEHYKEKFKAGHLGTLDPLATGVLPIAINYSTRLFDFFQEKKKLYRATFTFGIETDTLDSSGNIIDRTNNIPSIEEIKRVLSKFIGKQKQIPPKYSSKLINGKRAYDLARQGKDFELKAKEIEIYNIDFISFENNILELDLSVSSGTYIRAIARDVANMLNSLAYMSSLIRINAHSFNINDAVTLDEFSRDPEKYILNIEDYLDIEQIKLSDDEEKLLINTGKIKKEINSARVYVKTDTYIAILKNVNNILEKEAIIWKTL